MKITIIGAGVMGTIFLEALHKSVADFEISITDSSFEKLEKIKKDFAGVQVFTDNSIAVKNAEIVLLAVKPQSFAEMAEQVKGKIGSALVLSIMAGIKMERIKEILGTEKIVRAMPNLGARVLTSMTVWTGRDLSEKEKEIVGKIFKLVGEEIYVENENKIDGATAVSGSGPGFFYYFLEEWIKAAKEIGFGEEEAKKMILTTVMGSTKILEKDNNPEELRKQVTSKGGTTEAGLEVMVKTSLKEIMTKVMKAAQKRAQELSE